MKQEWADLREIYFRIRKQFDSSFDSPPATNPLDNQRLTRELDPSMHYVMLFHPNEVKTLLLNS